MLFGACHQWNEMVKMNSGCCLGNDGSVNEGRHDHRGGKCSVKSQDKLTGSGNVEHGGEIDSGCKVSITQAEARKAGDRSV